MAEDQMRRAVGYGRLAAAVAPLLDVGFIQDLRREHSVWAPQHASSIAAFVSSLLGTMHANVPFQTHAVAQSLIGHAMARSYSGEATATEAQVSKVIEAAATIGLPVHDLEQWRSDVREAATPARQPASKAAQRVAEKPSVLKDGRRLLWELYGWDQAASARSGKRAWYAPAQIAERYAWDAARMNKALEYLENFTCIELERATGAKPFIARRFAITVEGITHVEDNSTDVLPEEGPNMAATTTTTPDPKKVFIIHGRNVNAAKELGRFLKSLGLTPRPFDKVREEHGSKTVIEVIEQGMSESQGVIALFTSDEYAALRPDHYEDHDEPVDRQRWQARPNVIFEAGMAVGRDRNRVLFVLLGAVKLFSDVAGVTLLYPGKDYSADSQRARLRQTLKKGLHCEVDMTTDDWQHEGDFEKYVLPEVSTSSPFRPA